MSLDLASAVRAVKATQSRGRTATRTWVLPPVHELGNLNPSKLEHEHEVALAFQQLPAVGSSLVILGGKRRNLGPGPGEFANDIPFARNHRWSRLRPAACWWSGATRLYARSQHSWNPYRCHPVSGRASAHSTRRVYSYQRNGERLHKPQLHGTGGFAYHLLLGISPATEALNSTLSALLRQLSQLMQSLRSTPWGR